MHGNERIGPTAVVEFVTYLVEEYQHDANIRRLVDTRLVVAMPMPNAWGYYHNRREEINLDPNRDFAFNTKPDRCMETIAARAINEVWLEHVFQLGVTFHGGDNLIGYPWGDESHCLKRGIRSHQLSPCSEGFVSGDKIAMHGLGKFLVDISGEGFGVDGLYKLGEMNHVIYPVEGGMEDWAYGGSWHSEKTYCKPNTYKGYRKEKTTYDDETLRTVLYLVETSDNKIPNANTLGTRYQRTAEQDSGSKSKKTKFDSNNLLYPATHGDGHIPRNIRLSLGVLNAVEPYIKIQYVKPKGFRKSGSKRDTMVFFMQEVGVNLNGVEKIDSLHCKYSQEGDCQVSNIINTKDWSAYGGLSIADNLVIIDVTLKISLSKFERLSTKDRKEDYVLQVGLRCDSHWSQIPKNSADKVHEAHWVNVRTNPQYKVENAHAKIIGRDIWWSKDTVVPDVRKTMLKLMSDKQTSQGVDKVLHVPGANQVSDNESDLKRIHSQRLLQVSPSSEPVRILASAVVFVLILLFYGRVRCKRVV